MAGWAMPYIFPQNLGFAPLLNAVPPTEVY